MFASLVELYMGLFFSLRVDHVPVLLLESYMVSALVPFLVELCAPMVGRPCLAPRSLVAMASILGLVWSVSMRTSLS